MQAAARRLTQRPELVETWRDSEEILDAIASESKRCGDIVSNLFSFARGSGSRREPIDINLVAKKALF